MGLENIDSNAVAAASGLSVGYYFWSTDFAFTFNDGILLPILNRTISSESWYAINTGILTLAYEGIVATAYLEGKRRGEGSLKKGIALTTTSLAASLLSYATITQALIYEKTGSLEGLAKLVTQLHPLAEKVGLSMQRSFDVWNLSAVILATGFVGLYFGVRELVGYMQQKPEQEE